MKVEVLCCVPCMVLAVSLLSEPSSGHEVGGRWRGGRGRWPGGDWHDWRSRWPGGGNNRRPPPPPQPPVWPGDDWPGDDPFWPVDPNPPNWPDWPPYNTLYPNVPTKRPTWRPPTRRPPVTSTRSTRSPIRSTRSPIRTFPPFVTGTTGQPAVTATTLPTEVTASTTPSPLDNCIANRCIRNTDCPFSTGSTSFVSCQSGSCQLKSCTSSTECVEGLGPSATCRFGRCSSGNADVDSNISLYVLNCACRIATDGVTVNSRDCGPQYTGCDVDGTNLGFRQLPINGINYSIYPCYV